MTGFQQSICQKLAQITYDESMSSSGSSNPDDDNAEFMWNGVDERNMSELFWNNREERSKRLVGLLKIQASSEKLSKQRKRRRTQSAQKPEKLPDSSQAAIDATTPEDLSKTWHFDDPFEVSLDLGLTPGETLGIEMNQLQNENGPKLIQNEDFTSPTRMTLKRGD